jgi:hypothetical protein
VQSYDDGGKKQRTRDAKKNAVPDFLLSGTVSPEWQRHSGDVLKKIPSRIFYFPGRYFYKKPLKP